MANLKLTDLVTTTQTTPGDAIYLVQGESKQVALSTFYNNIPTDVNIQTTSEYLSGGTPITTLFDALYAKKLSKEVITLNGGTFYPTVNTDLSASGNATVVLSSGNVGFITVHVPQSANGMPSSNWEVEFIQAGPAKIYVRASDSSDLIIIMVLLL